MAAIKPIEFGKNLRPSTVDALNKINEIIAVVNGLNPGDISQLLSDVSSLKSQMTTAKGNITLLQSSVSTAETNIEALTSSVNSNTSDLDDVKLTLYSPLKSNE